MTKQRSARVSARGYEVREENYRGRRHLVVPIVALVEGVIHAANAENPEFVPAAELRAFGWNGRPIFFGHPLRNGEFVPGNTPELLEREAIGTIFNAAVRGRRLLMEAWLDAERTAEIAPELLERIEDREPIEVSTGVFTETDNTAGTFGGKDYVGAWHDIIPDHLAILADDTVGACSVEMGCGVRAAAKPQEGVTNVSKYKNLTADQRAAVERFLTKNPLIPRSLVERVCKSCADKMRELKISQIRASQIPADLLDGLCEKFGPSEGFRERCMESTLGDFDPSDQEAFCNFLKEECGFATAQRREERGLLSRLRTWLRGAELTDNDLRAVLAERLAEKEGGQPVWVEAVLFESGTVVYSVMTSEGMYTNDLFQRAYLQEGDAVTVGDERTEVTRTTSYVSKMNANPGEVAREDKERIMQKTERVKALIAKSAGLFKETDQKFLEGASDDQLAQFEASVAKAATDLKAAQDAAAASKPETPKPETPKPAEPTFESLLAAAKPEVRELIESNLRAAEQRKTDTIKQLRDSGRCDLTDDQLKAKSQVELDALVKLMGVEPRAAVDFGGRGAPRDDRQPTEAPAPPSMLDAIKAAQAARM